MFRLLKLVPLLVGALAYDTSLHTTSQLDPSVPIYLGEVFWPPSMTLMAWLPSEVQEPLEVGVKDLTNFKKRAYDYNPDLDWCYKATDATNNALFSLAGVDALQIQDYFSEQAYITREGKRYANCWITPESVRMGACEGRLDANEDRDCETGHKFTGPGTKRWSCWVTPGLVKNGSQIVGGAVGSQGDKLTDVVLTPTSVVTGAMSSEVLGAFTAGVTGS